MATSGQPRDARLRRLAEELAENGLELDLGAGLGLLIAQEVDHALRPAVHERRVFSIGTFVGPTTDPAGWEAGSGLGISRGPMGDMALEELRRFADGLSSWVMRHIDGRIEWVVFDRPTGSERDLVVLADVLGATVVQRHPTGAVRIAGSFGVLRSEGLSWHHEPPVSRWVDELSACGPEDLGVVHALLEFAVHDLGSRGIGATLVHRRADGQGTGVEHRLPAPPPLPIMRPDALAPLRHAISQVDGAAIFDRSGTLRQLGARLNPSADAQSMIDGLGGMRHTSGRRYSYDNPTATVIVVSEDGPVSVFRNGELLGRSPT